MTGEFHPVRVCEVELSCPLPVIEGHQTGTEQRARVLARWYREPLAFVDVPLTGGVATPGELAQALWREVGQAVTRRFAEAGEQAPATLPVTGLRLAGPSAYLRGLAEVIAAAPAATVIVCTRDRAERLASCLAAVTAQDYPEFEVIVVDNAPADNRVAELVSSQSWPVPVRRVVEPRPGLAWARNQGLHAATGRFVAYLDDDEHPDRYWLAELARAFTLAPGVEGVSGIVLPAALDTPAQCLFEQFGGHSKGRGLTAQVFDPASHARQHPLYPLPPFGVGASMAFDRQALLRAGGFDVALGAGTPARAGEDTAVISDLMLRGGTFVYWPGAIMWHEHRREIGEMERQLFGYGSGLTAFYLRALLRNPGLLPVMLRLTPRALRDLRGRDSVRTATMGEDYPPALRRATRRGMLAGPALYLRSRRVQARVAAQARLDARARLAAGAQQAIQAQAQQAIQTQTQTAQAQRTLQAQGGPS
jgi:glycosyltransferase involved in cell wall biosynthesis